MSELDNIPQYDKTPRSIAQDTRLSPEALGILIYLRSLPSTWEINAIHLRGLYGWGRDKAQRVLMELVEYEYLELTKGGSGGGSKYKLRELAEDEALRWYSESRKIRSPVGESEDRKSPTSGKSRRGKIRSSYRDNYNSRNKEIKQMIDDERGPHPDRDRDFSFFKQESDIFYESEIRELVSRIPDPVMIWTNQTGKSGMGAAPIQVIVELVQRYGLEIYAAGIVIGKNESRNERISLRFCERIMSRLKSQSTPKYDKRIPKSGNGLGSALPDDL